MEVLQFPKDKKKHVYFEKTREGRRKKSETTYGCHSVAKRGLRFFKVKSLPLFAREKDKNGIVW